MRHYFVPDISRVSARQVYLTAFYSEALQLPDGFLYWCLRDQCLPLLSHLSRPDQVEALHLAAENYENPDAVLAIAGLIDCGLLEASWLGSKQWELKVEDLDSEEESGALEEFSTRMKAQRPQIGQNVRLELEEDPSLESAKAIRRARVEAAGRVLGELEGTPFGRYREFLASRFQNHLEEYMQADERVSEQSRGSGSSVPFSGHIADLAQDLALNPDLVPILEDREWQVFSEQLALDDEALATGVRSILRRDSVALRVGLTLLSRLPRLRFEHAEDVAQVRDETSEAIGAFHTAIVRYAAELDDGEVSVALLERLVRREVQEDVEALVRDRATRLGVCDAVAGAANIGLLILTAVEPIAVVLGALALAPTAQKVLRSTPSSQRRERDLGLALRFS